jgi:chromosome segregation ATPase
MSFLINANERNLREQLLTLEHDILKIELALEFLKKEVAYTEHTKRILSIRERKYQLELEEKKCQIDEIKRVLELLTQEHEAKKFMSPPSRNVDEI